MGTDNKYIREQNRLLGKPSGPGHEFKSRELRA